MSQYHIPARIKIIHTQRIPCSSHNCLKLSSISDSSQHIHIVEHVLLIEFDKSLYECLDHFRSQWVPSDIDELVGEESHHHFSQVSAQVDRHGHGRDERIIGELPLQLLFHCIGGDDIHTGFGNELDQIANLITTPLHSIDLAIRHKLCQLTPMWFLIHVLGKETTHPNIHHFLTR